MQLSIKPSIPGENQSSMLPLIVDNSTKIAFKVESQGQMMPDILASQNHTRCIKICN